MRGDQLVNIIYIYQRVDFEEHDGNLLAQKIGTVEGHSFWEPTNRGVSFPDQGGPKRMRTNVERLRQSSISGTRRGVDWRSRIPGFGRSERWLSTCVFSFQIFADPVLRDRFAISAHYR